MIYPPNVTTVIVNFDFSSSTGSGISPSGVVSFQPNVTLYDGTDGEIVLANALNVVLSAGGGTVTLMATDDSHLVPTGWWYDVTFNVGNQVWGPLPYFFPAGGSPFDLSTLAPAVGLPALIQYVSLAAVGAHNGVASLDNTGNVPLSQLSNAPGGGGTPSNTVVTEQTYGQGSTAGTATLYSRGDHTHGTPTAPSIPAGSSTVVASATFGQSASAGAAGTYSKGDHVHGTPAAPAVPTAATTVVAGTSFGQSSAVGVDATYAREDHAHGTPTAQAIPGAGTTVVASTSFGQAAAVGVDTTFAREDHVHGTPAAPSIPAGATTVVAETTYAQSSNPGSAGTYSKGDHTHGTQPLSAATPSTMAVGDAAATGTATNNSREDHKHGAPAFAAPTAQTTYGLGSATGAAATVPHSDHTHGTPALSAVAPSNSAVGDTAAVGTGATPARTDHVHGREAFGNVVAQTTFGLSSGNGTATTEARSDHTHGTPAAPAVPAAATTVTAGTAYGAAQAVGTATTYAREDHNHGTIPVDPIFLQGAVRPIAGRYAYVAGSGATGTVSPSLNQVRYQPCPVDIGFTWDTINIEVTTGVATSVVRIGLFADAGTGLPGALITDYGTVSAAAAAVMTITPASPVQFQSRTLYWIGTIVQVAGASAFRAQNCANPLILPNSTGVTTAAINAYTENGVSGSFNPTATPGDASGAPRIMLHIVSVP